MQYTINFDMKGQFRLEKDLNSKEKHIIILKRKYCKSENAYTSFLFGALDMLFYYYGNKMQRVLRKN